MSWLDSPWTAAAVVVVSVLVAVRFVGAGLVGRRHDRDVKAQLAQRLSASAQVVAHARHLQRSREKLVTAREEERRRLQRDLHDGLGPTLAGIGVQLEVSRGLVRDDPDKAETILDAMAAETRAAIDSVRELVHDLRPTVLDQLGLLAAVREQAMALAAAGQLIIEVVEPASAGELDRLPAAIEVATYRIAVEAMANVVRHASARTCVVSLAVDEEVRLTVVDDGRGLGVDSSAGVGLRSMKERAAELGGTVVIETGAHGGTRVTASFPTERR